VLFQNRQTIDRELDAPHSILLAALMDDEIHDSTLAELSQKVPLPETNERRKSLFLFFIFFT